MQHFQHIRRKFQFSSPDSPLSQLWLLLLLFIFLLLLTIDRIKKSEFSSQFASFSIISDEVWFASVFLIFGINRDERMGWEMSVMWKFLSLSLTLQILSKIFCILLTASLIALPAKENNKAEEQQQKSQKKHETQQIDQKSMEFQDKINKCHVDIFRSFLACSLRCMLRKQHHRQWKWHSAYRYKHIHTLWCCGYNLHEKKILSLVIYFLKIKHFGEEKFSLSLLKTYA